jgi:peptide/nickel transport system permease protein
MAHGFREYILKRLLYLAITVMLILSFNFILFRVMPGDMSSVLIPKGADNETRELLKEYYGLNEPLITQYIVYMQQTLTGDFGKTTSVDVGSDVGSVIWTRLANTLVLVGIGTFLSIILGVYFGRETAWRRGKAADKVGSSFFLVFYCMPTFLFALVILMLAAHYMPNWPIKGVTSDDYSDLTIWGKILDRTQHLLLPLAALVVETIATFSIITRSSLIDVLTEDYMTTAVAKGLRGKRVLKNHAMPNAMPAVVTVVAINVGWVLSGSIMIEIIFTYQGLGWLTWKAVWARDFPLLQAAFLLEILAVLIANFVADMMLFKLDPRVKA